MSQERERQAVAELEAAVAQEQTAVLQDIQSSGSYHVITQTSATATMTARALPVSSSTAPDESIDLDFDGIPGASVSMPASLASFLSFGKPRAIMVTAFNMSATDAASGMTQAKAMMAIDVFSLSSQAKISGLSGFAEPMRFTLATAGIEDQGGSNGQVLQCAYWDEGHGEWSFEGVTTVPAQDGSGLSCTTTHLSLFGAILAELEAVFVCSNAEILEPESLSRIIEEADWLLRPTAIFVVIVVLLHLGLLGVALYYDYRDKEDIWTDQFFITKDASFAKDQKSGIMDRIFENCHDLKMMKVKADEPWRNVRTKRSPVGIVVTWLASRFLVVMTRYNVAAEHSIDSQTLVFVEARVQKKHNKMKKTKTMMPSRSPRSMSSPCSILSSTAHDGATCVQDKDSDAQRSRDHLSSLHSFMWHSSHDMHKQLHDGPSLFKQFLVLFIALQPLSVILHRAVLAPRGVRALLQMSKSFGAMCASGLFFVLSNSAQSHAADPRCSAQGALGSIVRQITVGLASTLISGLPVVILAALQTREMTYVQDDEVGQKKLRRWQILTYVLWVVGSVYSAFCVVYVFSFLANVSKEDCNKWGVSAFIALLQSLFLQPIILAVVMSVAVKIAVKLPGAEEGSKELLQKALCGHNGVQKADSSQTEQAGDVKEMPRIALNGAEHQRNKTIAAHKTMLTEEVCMAPSACTLMSDASYNETSTTHASCEKKIYITIEDGADRSKAEAAASVLSKTDVCKGRNTFILEDETSWLEDRSAFTLEEPEEFMDEFEATLEGKIKAKLEKFGETGRRPHATLPAAPIPELLTHCQDI